MDPRRARWLSLCTGTFTPGTLYTAVTPCNANNAPQNCPGPGFADNYLGSINLKTGAVDKVSLSGLIAAKGMIFVP